ncbi:glycosyltransferase [Skermanella sp. TT6]|uniref:Glycosyltransferase n=1 Tax=Skermanella cutis TaxID=2775420 RepID=A0ABX7B9K5_9PROT|nr:glycosyltransferase [Skermanella sp. TT6]QQP91059.1 glycosyltransferase [Skermanella sp. TT6]
MRFVYFTHSLVSDWNHGNAHFLRGVIRELTARGHQVQVFEPRNGWSLQNLIADQGAEAVARFAAVFPGFGSTSYDPVTLDLDRALDGADVVIVHEWNDHGLVADIGRRRAAGGRFQLLFHDTHHRSVTDPKAMAAYDLTAYDGVLAYGAVIREIYLKMGWGRRAWTWHEAADTALFRPLPGRPREGDLVWIGNWGDGERSVELGEFLLLPIRQLKLKARIHGVRYPADAKAAIALAGAEYAGYLPNHEAPEAFARFPVTVHVPRRPYVETLRGIPTIRPFEALACGIPLVCSPWDDAEGLFRPGSDYLIARDGTEMTKHLRDILNDLDLAASLARSGYETVQSRHTCGHRVDELLEICRGLKQERPLLQEAR